MKVKTYSYKWWCLMISLVGSINTAIAIGATFWTTSAQWSLIYVIIAATISITAAVASEA